MSTIDIKINVLDSAINELANVKRTCDGFKKTPPSTIGGVKTVNELEEIGKLYQTMNDHLSAMIGSTITLLQKTKDGFQTNDQTAAKKIK